MDNIKNKVVNLFLANQFELLYQLYNGGVFTWTDLGDKIIVHEPIHEKTFHAHGKAYNSKIHELSSLTYRIDVNYLTQAYNKYFGKDLLFLYIYSDSIGIDVDYWTRYEVFLYFDHIGQLVTSIRGDVNHEVYNDFCEFIDKMDFESKLKETQQELRFLKKLDNMIHYMKILEEDG